MKNRLGLGLSLFLLFQGIFGFTASGVVGRVPDETEVYLQVESLIDIGSYAMPQMRLEQYYGRFGLRGEYYAARGPGCAILALPHHLAARAIARLGGVPRSSPVWRELVSAITSLATSTWGALAVVGLFEAALALGAGIRRAAGIALLLGGTTLIWPYATFFYTEVQAAALVIFAIAWQLRGKSWLVAGAVFSLLMLKLANGIILPALLAIAVGDAWRVRCRADALRLARALLPMSVAVLIAIAVHGLWNWHRYGDVFEAGYVFGQYFRPGETARIFALSELPFGLAVLLLSPGKSLLVYCPIAAFAVWRFPALWREHPSVARAWGIALLSYLLFFGSFVYPEGGFSFGPRYLVPLVPLLLLPLACGVLPNRTVLVGAAVLGCCVQLLGVSVSFTLDQSVDLPEQGTSGRNAYYEVYPAQSQEVATGRPLNVYRLDYNPFARYPKILWRFFTSTRRRSKTGVEFFPLHLLRVRAWRGMEALPAWIPYASAGLFVSIAALGVRGVIAGLTRESTLVSNQHP